MCSACNRAKNLELVFLCPCGGTTFRGGEEITTSPSIQIVSCSRCSRSYGIPSPMIAGQPEDTPTNLIYREPPPDPLMARKAWRWAHKET